MLIKHKLIAGTVTVALGFATLFFVLLNQSAQLQQLQIKQQTVAQLGSSIAQLLEFQRNLATGQQAISTTDFNATLNSR